MAATRSEIIARVQLRLPPHRAESTIPARADTLEEFVLRGCRLLAERAMDDPQIEKRLTTSVNITLGGGGTLSLDDTSIAKLLPESLESAVLHLTAFAEPADYLGQYFDFINTTPHPEIPTWSIFDNAINVKSGDGDRPVAAATGILHDAIFIPYLDEPTASATTLPPSLEEQLVDTVVMLYKQELGGGQAQPPAAEAAG